jgi:hypothetical protein
MTSTPGIRGFESTGSPGAIGWDQGQSIVGEAQAFFISALAFR